MKPDKSRILSDLQASLSPKRFAHTLGVAETAAKLALRFGADPQDAALAGLLHDITREKNLAEQLIICRNYGIIIEEAEQSSPALLHSATAAALAEHVYGASAGIVSAIACHTTGKVGMTALDKTLCLADSIEPGRDFPGAAELRKAAWENPHRALLQALDGTIVHLIQRGEFLHPDTVFARNDLLSALRVSNPS